jgi:hypothetical protein
MAPRTHGARLGARVECAAFQHIAIVAATRHPHQICLGVAGAVVLGVDGIFRFQQHGAIRIHQDRAEGVIAFFARTPGNSDGSAQVSRVVVVHSEEIGE